MIQTGCCIGSGAFVTQGEHGTLVDVEKMLETDVYVRSIGYSYTELSANVLDALSEADIARIACENRQGRTGFRTCNGFLPKTLSIWKPEDRKALENYIDRILGICHRIGIETMVFGSGASRQYPDSMTEADAFQGFAEFLRLCGACAEKHQVTLVIEPLNRKETNLICTVAQGAQLVARVNHPRIALLADIYHMYMEGETADILKQTAPLLRHVHISSVPDRLVPCFGCSGEAYLREAAQALKSSGYRGRVSIEALYNDFDQDAAKAFPCMKELFG